MLIGIVWYHEPASLVRILLILLLIEFVAGLKLTSGHKSVVVRRGTFLVTEGLFFLRHYRLMELNPEERERNTAAIRHLLDDGNN